MEGLKPRSGFGLNELLGRIGRVAARAVPANAGCVTKEEVDACTANSDFDEHWRRESAGLVRQHGFEAIEGSYDGTDDRKHECFDVH